MLSNIILIIAAVLPAAILMVLIFCKDKVEREPIGVVLRLALFGAAATLIAARLNHYGMVLLSWLPDGLYTFLFYFLVVGPVEEGVKYGMLRTNTWNNSNFNYTFDALVYSCFVGLGFALWENVDYVLDYGLTTALLRAITAVPGHCSFAVFMGLFYGAAKQADLAGDAAKRKKNNWLAWLIPALIHGCYDYVAVNETTLGSMAFFGFIAVMFIIALITFNRAAKRDSALVQKPAEDADPDWQ